MFRIFIATAISASTFAQERPVLPAEELLQHIPASIEGFKPVGNPVARVIKIGTLSYSLAERNFAQGKQKIKILLFDYNNALIMYSQAVKNSARADSLLVYPAQQPASSYHYYHESLTENFCRISLGINGRFFVNISCEHADASVLQRIVAGFNFSGLERTSVEEPKFR